MKVCKVCKVYECTLNDYINRGFIYFFYFSLYLYIFIFSPLSLSNYYPIVFSIVIQFFPVSLNHHLGFFHLEILLGDIFI